MVYTAIAQSEGELEIQSLVYRWTTASPIVEAAVAGDRYWDPNTERFSQLIGQTEFQNITATALLSRNQFLALDALFNSDLSKNGLLTASHIMGNINTTLSGVRIMRISYGGFDKASNSSANVEIEISFTSRTVN